MTEEREHLLEKRRVAVMTTVDRAWYETTTRNYDFIRDQLTAKLESWLLADHLADDYYEAEYFVPSSPWQHLKELFNRWPWSRLLTAPQYEKRVARVRVARYLMYPDARIDVPEMGDAVIIYERVEET